MSKTLFNIDDAFLFESELNEEDRLIMETARDYAQSSLEPRVLKGNTEEFFDISIAQEIGEMGLLGVNIPEEYGGAGASYTAYGLVAREVERVDSGYRSFMSVQSSLVMYPISIFGTEEQKQKYIPLNVTAARLCFLAYHSFGCPQESHRSCLHRSLAWIPPSVSSLVMLCALLLLRAICLDILTGTLPQPGVQYGARQ